MSVRPLLCLDVDGVLAPLDQCEGCEQVWTEQGDWAWFSPKNRARLRLLARAYQLVWTTSWEHQANRIVGPWHGLGPLPVIEWDLDLLGGSLEPDDPPAGWTGYHDWKLPWIQRYVGTRRFAWIDDEVSPEGIAWAERCEIPTLFLRPDPALGLTDDHVERLLDFAEG